MRDLAYLALVAPYTDLADLAGQVCAELGEDVTIATGDLAEGVKVARELAARGAEVIISRGGTATAIARYLEIPVVEIAVSAFDLIRALADARRLGSYIGVVGFRNIIYGTKRRSSRLSFLDIYAVMLYAVIGGVISMEYKYRTQLYLDAEQYQFLKERAASYNISMAEVVRQLIAKEQNKQEEIDPEDPIFHLGQKTISTGRYDGSVNHDRYIYRRSGDR